MAGNMSPELAQAIIASSRRLGIDPVDLGTAISYETGGRMSPSLWGGKDNNYLGLIQFGPEERAKYGVRPDQSAVDQMGAVENFLRDRGVKPGMGMLDIYSTINAGSPGLYNRSDAGNGGAPGTVADKVNYQMAGHRANVVGALNGSGYIPPAPAAPQDPTSPIDPTSTAAPVASSAPLAMTAPVGALGNLAQAGNAFAGAAQPQAPAPAENKPPEFLPLQQIAMGQAANPQALALAQAIAKQYGG